MLSKKLSHIFASEVMRASLIIFGVVLAAYLVAPLMGLSQNPIYQKSGLATVIEPGHVTGQSTIDPNDGFTSQALGKLSAEKILSGDMPYWNHYEGVGSPLAAGMQGASLFPLVVVQALDNGLVYFHVILQVTAGVAAFLFFKKVRLPFWIAVTGGVVFALNGTFAWLTNAPFNPIPFLPLLLLGIECALSSAEKQRKGGWVLIAFSLSLSLYAGFPETAFLSAIFAYGWGLIRLFQLKTNDRKSYIIKVLIGSVVGLLLAAPVLLPFLGYLPYATTGGHEGGSFAELGLPTSSLPALYLPYIFGPIFGLLQNGQPTDLFLFWGNVGGYITAPLVLVSAFAVFSKRPRSHKLYLALFILVVVLKIFAFRPVSVLVNLIPGMDLIAFYRYAVPVLSMAFIMLAVFGLEALAKKQVTRKSILFICGGALATLGLSAIYARGLFSQLSQFPSARLWAMLSMGWAVAFVVGVLIVLLYDKKKIKLPLILAALVLDAFIMFIIPMFSIPKTTTVNMGPVTFLQQNLGQQRFYTLYPIQPNYGSYFKISSININNLPVPKNWAEHVESKLDTNVDAILFTGFSRHDPTGPTALEEFGANQDNYEAIGVKYLVAQKGAVDPTFVTQHQLTDVYDDGQVEIFQLANPKPYAEAAGCKIEVQDHDNITADCQAATNLTRRELSMPGWAARVNGQNRTLGATEDIFQAVPLSAGKSTVHFEYNPPHMWLGYGAFVVGIAAVGATLWRQRFKR